MESEMDNEPAQASGPSVAPKLDPYYRPATSDDMLAVRFSGNTSTVAGAKLEGLTPFQLWAAAAWLNLQAEKMVLQAESRAIQEMMERQRLADALRTGQDIMTPGKLRGD
jgi:hypothetical protein